MKGMRYLLYIVACVMTMLCSCDKEDGNEFFDKSIQPFREIRVMTYSKSGNVDTTCTAYTVYKLTPLVVNANLQKEYEVRNFSVAEDKHLKWDFDYLAAFDVDMSLGNDDIISVDYEYFMLRGYELVRMLSRQGEVNYDDNGKIAFSFCHPSGNNGDDLGVAYEYDDEGHLNSFEERQLGYGYSKVLSDATFTWRDGNIVGVLHNVYSELDGVAQRTTSRVDVTYSKGVEDSHSMLPFILDNVCGVSIASNFDYEDYFSGKYGISARNVITRIVVTSYKQQPYIPDSNLDETDAEQKTYEVTPRIGKDKLISDYSVADPDNKPYHTVFCYVRK